MKIIYLLFIVLYFSIGRAQAQMTIELGATFGFVSYQGDLAPSSIRGTINQIHPYNGVYAQLHPTRFFGIELYSSWGSLSGNDILQLDDGRRRRNLHFRSKIHEVGSRLLIYLPIEFKKIGLKTDPYILAGVGIFRFNPETEFKGLWYKLRDLNTEGQNLEQYPDRKPYDLHAMTIPIGAGIRVELRNQWSFRFEGIMHTTSTDYLDDVSKSYPNLELLKEERGFLTHALANRTAERDGINDASEGGVRGNPDEDDWYISFQLKIAKNFQWVSKGQRKSQRHLKCAKF